MPRVSPVQPILNLPTESLVDSIDVPRPSSPNHENLWGAKRLTKAGGNGSRILSKRKASVIQDATLRFQQPHNPWKHSPIDWLNVLINLITYALLLSDVPRAGTRAQLNMREISPGKYAYFGAFAYEVITFVRDPFQPLQVNATKGNSSVVNSRIWSYTYDTTSTGIRSITRGFNSSGSYILRCMNYELNCDAFGFFAVPDTFFMLDRVVEAVVVIPDAVIPSIYPPHADRGFQLLRSATTLKTRQIYIVYDKMVKWVLDSIQMRLMRFFHWRRVDASFDVCANARDRPYFCDCAPVADYRVLADPTSAESVNVKLVWDSVNAHVRATYNNFHNLTNDVTVDVTILEGYTEPLTYVGSWAKTVRAQFEIVVLTRVRDCSRQDSLNSDCTTIRLIDYRYEGGIIITNVDDWNPMVTMLRVVAQGYYIVRVITLFLGCYYAFPLQERSWRLATFLFCSEAPSHVVAFGSPLPIFLYASASLIDGTAVDAVIHAGVLGLQGSFTKDPGRIYRIVCLVMRRQWVMAFLTMVWVRFQAFAGHFDRHLGIVSVRGHVFGFLATWSMLIGLYHPKLRDTRVIAIGPASPASSSVAARLFARDPSNRRVSGVYADLASILLSAVFHMTLVLLLRVVLYFGYRLKSGVYQKTTLDARTKESPRAAKTTKRGVKIVGRKNFFFCQTEMLPSTCHALWMIEGLTCGWANDVFLQMLMQRYQGPTTPVDHSRRGMLINIVQLSEPLNYLRLQFGMNNQSACTYLESTSQKSFRVINLLTGDPVFSKEIRANRVQFVSKRPAKDLPFHELVQCR